METFYFDTGVRPYGHIPPVTLWRDQVWRNGTNQIPFDCEGVPEGATLLFLAPKNDLREASLEWVTVHEVHNSSMCSDYAYFSSRPKRPQQ